MRQIFIIFFLIAVTACSGVKSDNSASVITPAGNQRAQKSSSYPIPANKQLPQPPGSSFGAAVPNDGSSLHGWYNGNSPVTLPNNASADKANFIQPQAVASSLQIGSPSNVTVKAQPNGQALMPWSQVKTKNIWAKFIDPNRQVYEVVATYNSPFTVHGNLYSSGQRTIVIDAQTGRAIYGITTGHLVSGSMIRPLRPPTPTPRQNHDAEAATLPVVLLENPTIRSDYPNAT